MAVWNRIKTRSLYGREPVTVWGAINAALVSTWGVIVLAVSIKPEIAGAVTTAIGAWVLVASFIARRSTTPYPTEIDVFPARPEP